MGTHSRAIGMLAAGCLLAGAGLVLSPGTVSESRAGDPDAYMNACQDAVNSLLDPDNQAESAANLVGQIDQGLESASATEIGSDFLLATGDSTASAIAEHVALHGWTDTLLHLRDVLLTFIP